MIWQQNPKSKSFFLKSDKTSTKVVCEIVNFIITTRIRKRVKKDNFRRELFYDSLAIASCQNRFFGLNKARP